MTVFNHIAKNRDGVALVLHIMDPDWHSGPVRSICIYVYHLFFPDICSFMHKISEPNFSDKNEIEYVTDLNNIEYNI